jgi:hypothetical protein
MAGIAMGDRVIWKGALTESGEPKPGSWAGNGRGVIADFEPLRRFFRGGENAEDGAPRGPAVGILLDGGDPTSKKKHDVWVRPDAAQIVPDLEPLKEPS